MADLDRYRAKRRFDRTPEPAGGEARAGETIFVVQKHRARRLHYDLRLQIGATLKSWAVPEGPCLDPKVRRFAKLVEDHPLDYAGFEGTIPAGNYGAGEVIVWDRGVYASVADPAEAFASGEFKFRLAGEKLGGGWMLKRLPDDPTHWLLIKERDPSARAITDYDVVRDAPLSVISGRRVEDLRVAAPSAPLASPRVGAPSAPLDPSTIPGAKPAPLPQRFAPQLATAAATPPSQPGWAHEIKHDGYRTLAFVENCAVRFITRNGLDWTGRYGALAKPFAKLACRAALIDGEVVVQDARGVSSLEQLERALSEGRTGALTFYAFDLAHLDGFDLTRARLDARKAALQRLLAPIDDPRSALQFSEHVEGDGAALFEQAARIGVEGIVSKRLDARYVSGRSAHWLKVKRVETSEQVVIGFTTNAPKRVAALILAEEGADGALSYSGRVGSGIGEDQARDLFEMLSPCRREKPPASGAPRLKAASWTEPAFMARIAHRGRSAAGASRQPTYLGIAPRAAAAPPAPRARKPRLLTDRDLAAIHLTNPERLALEEGDVTKLDVALHYARIGDWMLPELLRRPVSLIRCPTGKKKDCFYQRHAFHGLPPGVERIDLAADDEEERAPYLTVVEPRGLLGLTQFGALEFHLWGCRIDDPERPDRLVFDLDPASELPWARLCDAAEAMRARLEALGFKPFLRTTGGKGVHLVVALKAADDWPAVKAFAEATARAVAADAPELFTANLSKKARAGRVFVDYLRNGRGATAVASYALRARPEFTVATPIEWNTLRTLEGGGAFTIKNIVNHIETLAIDPWEALSSSAIRISPKMRRDVGLR